MKLKKASKASSVILALCLLLSSLTLFSGCASGADIVLRVYSWEEYIDDGGKGSFIYDQLHEEDEDTKKVITLEESDLIDKEYKDRYLEMTGIELDANGPSVLDDFSLWYQKKYGKSVRVEYSTFGTNEDMYNQLKLGNSYDLVCPSDYMIMKLAAEGMLEPLSDEGNFSTDQSNEYAQNVSTYIADVFQEGKLNVPKETVDENGKKSIVYETDEDGKKHIVYEEHSWNEYAAGYMWGTTGLIYNPDKVTEKELEEQGWGILLNSDYKKKVTTKDNVRDSYFVGLAIAYERELYDLKAQYNADEIDEKEYNRLVTEVMNRTDDDSVNKVQDVLMDMKKNIFGFETDTGKADMVNGKIYMNFAWSGDAVYAMDLAEEDGLELNFFIPNEASNLFFDGWVIPKNEKRSAETKHAAQAFINFMSMPENAVRNSYYIGYTSVIAGDEMFDYVKDTYDEGEGEDYDLSYFFGEGAVIQTTEQNRQLLAQYPTKDVTQRCAVMYYYGEERDARINELWTKVKGAELDTWAIVVLCVAAVAIVLFIVISKFGNRIDLFRPKPKKGYELIKQERIQ